MRRRRLPMDISNDPYGEIIGTATDREWWNRTGDCGGCGMDTCHPGDACTPGWEGCRYCLDESSPFRLIPPSQRPAKETKPDPRAPQPGQTTLEDLL